MARAARAREPKETPERILAAALDAFSQDGFEGARTRDIAARAKVTLGLVQYHFGTKDALWKASVERAFADLERGFEALLKDPRAGDVRWVLQSMIRGHVRFVALNTAFVRIMHDEGKRRGPRMRWLADRYVGPFFDKITPIIARAQECGILLGGVDPAHFVYAFIGATSTIFHQSEECRRITGMDPGSEGMIEAQTRMVESLFLGPAGLGVTEPALPHVSPPA